MVFTFAHNLVSVGGAGMASGLGSVSSSAIGPNPNQYTVNLINVSDQQYVSVALLAAKDQTGSIGDIVGPQMGVLIGDVNATGGVDGNDVAAVQSQTRQPVNSDAEARFDVNATGAIDGNDVAITQGHTRTSLPSTP
jgi:hypothetical protein